MRTILFPVLAAALTLPLLACGAAKKEDGPKPAKVDPVAHESELMKITLAPEADRRLGIAVVRASAAAGGSTLATFGEVVIPPTVPGGVPITSTTDLAALAASQARADGDTARAAAQARAAELNLRRAEALVREEAGSVKARDDAQAVAAASRADLATARAQRRMLGAPVASLGGQGTLWVRVPVIAADMARIDRQAAATVIRSDSAGQVLARPVQAPPSANSAVGSVDLYFTVPSRDLQLGQRVPVTLALQGHSDGGLAIPASAIVYDIHGGEWVYVRVAPRSYERRRVQTGRLQADKATIVSGLSTASEVVTAGAAELFGTEFGTK